MLDIFVKLYALVKRIIVAVHSYANVSRALELFEFLAVLALSAAHHRREQLQFSSAALHNFVAYLVYGLPLYRSAALWTVRLSYTRVKQAQIIVNLGHSSDRRARIVRGGFLVDGHGGRQALDIIDVRLLHLTEEHTRIA